LTYIDARRLLDRVVRWLLANRHSPIDVADEIARIRPGVQQLLPRLAGLLPDGPRQAWEEHRSSLVAHGVPEHIADRATPLTYGLGLLDVVHTAHTTGHDLANAAQVYFALAVRFRVNDLQSKITALPKEERWEALARMALRYDLYAALAELAALVLGVAADAAPQAAVAGWERTNSAAIGRIHAAMDELSDRPADIAALCVLLRQIRTLARGSG
jgi:glutamate dehydrogenase